MYAVCTRSDGNVANTRAEMIKGLRPGVESMANVQQECAIKPSTEQISCATEKCPIMGLFMGALICGFGTTQDACNNFGNTCNWDGGKCSVNVKPVFDKLVPRGCPLRPFLGGSLQLVIIQKHRSNRNAVGRQPRARAPPLVHSVRL